MEQRISCKEYILDICIQGGEKLEDWIKMTPQKTKVKCNHLLKILRRKSNKDDTYLSPEESEQTHYLQAVLRNPPTHNS